MKALVIGGTGPTGPYVVEGLLDRGYDVTIFHSGQHEVEFTRPVAHLHGDVHFRETIAELVGDERYDLVVAMYGRLRVMADFFRGRTDRFVALTSSNGYSQPSDPRWGALGRPLTPDEQGVWQDDPEADKFAYLIHTSEETVLEAHRAGDFNATILRPPIMYGPRQLAPEDWCVMRRILDGQKRFIVADGGLKIDSRVYVENVAAALLLAVDRPDAAAGKRYNVGDASLYSMRQRIELIAKTMGAELELVDLPYALAKPCHVMWRYSPGHRAIDDHLIREELGYRDLVPAEVAIPQTVQWLLEHQPERGGEAERQLGDPFDYEAEDALSRAWEQSRSVLASVPFELPPPAHRYRHPKQPGEAWHRPASSSYARRQAP